MMKSPGTSKLLRVQSNQVKCPPPPTHILVWTVFIIHPCVMIILLELNITVFIETLGDFLIDRRGLKCMQYKRFHFNTGSFGLRSTWFACKKFYIYS